LEIATVGKEIDRKGAAIGGREESGMEVFKKPRGGWGPGSPAHKGGKRSYQKLRSVGAGEVENHYGETLQSCGTLVKEQKV